MIEPRVIAVPVMRKPLRAPLYVGIAQSSNRAPTNCPVTENRTKSRTPIDFTTLDATMINIRPQGPPM